MYTELGKKRRKEISLGPVSLGGDLEQKGDYVGGDPPWGESGSSHRFGVPVLGSYIGETNPLGKLEDC